MPKCNRCGKTVGFLEPYCTACIVTLAEERKEDAPQTVMQEMPLPNELTECPYCKGELVPGASKCQHCGEWVSGVGRVTSGQELVGCGLLAIGIIGGLLALLIDPSIGGINNLGLLADKQNYLIASGVVSIVGVLLFVLGSGSRA